MSSPIKKGGSLIPNWKALDYSLRPEINVTSEEYGEVEIKSRLVEGTIKIWDQAYKDFNRMEYLRLNDTEVINFKRGKSSTAEHIFDWILTTTDQDVEVAKRVSNLLSQSMFGTVQNMVEEKTGITQYEKKSDTLYRKTGEYPSKRYATLSGQLQRRSFKIYQDGTFKLIEEIIYKKMPGDDAGDFDPEKLPYIKEKILITGKVDDLRNPTEEKTKRLNMKVAYTKEFNTLDEAKKANYKGTVMGGSIIGGEDAKSLFELS